MMSFSSEKLNQLPYLSIDVPYLTVAAACIKLDKPVSAVFYAEVWCCSQQQRPVLPRLYLASSGAAATSLSASFTSMDSLPPEECLLLTAHCMLSDPDGPLAVATSSSHASARAMIAMHSSDAMTALSLSAAFSASTPQQVRSCHPSCHPSCVPWGT